MLPNHSPFIVAEQYGTLASLYPNRVDLGLGRAQGTDQATARAIRRHVAMGMASLTADLEKLPVCTTSTNIRTAFKFIIFPFLKNIFLFYTIHI
ncbi:alkanesulfonate monooxygenase SsuD/methylene tetrahydromethanopterin reductase-like flavin-dependent oxidoreductase (luciferase family) [Neisseria sp. HSC-16F19]|nr:alkanesulfonate monooxygenase SsuD/methylene tetrahydromethanopterin reductase-like flavin-dependent oxidoreductase (luciferase family) [Neisseria sp. HSC-16F19]